MAEVVTSDGAVRYAAAERIVAGMTSGGRIINIESGTQDPSATDVVATLWTARDFVDHIKKKSIQEARVIYKKAGTGLQFLVYRDLLGTTADATISLPTTGSNNFSRLTIPLPQAARPPADAIEASFTDSTASSQTAQSDVWGFETDMLLLDSY